MDLKDIKSLIKFVTETDITEFELENPDEKIRIKRGSFHDQTNNQLFQPLMQYNTPTRTEVPALPTESPSLPATLAHDEGFTITSPIVGTLYRSPAPDAPPYVEVGQIVEKGHVLCIIEAMKLMNEIEAEFRCRILRISKENAQPVEFGETLFVVEKM